MVFEISKFQNTEYLRDMQFLSRNLEYFMASFPHTKTICND